MWLKLILLTVVSLLITIQQVFYWSKHGTRRQAILLLIWMLIAWGMGCAFIGGFRLPEPTKPLFPNWK